MFRTIVAEESETWLLLTVRISSNLTGEKYIQATQRVLQILRCTLVSKLANFCPDIGHSGGKHSNYLPVILETEYKFNIKL